jgi:hypothetical protein
MDTVNTRWLEDALAVMMRSVGHEPDPDILHQAAEWLMADADIRVPPSDVARQRLSGLGVQVVLDWMEAEGIPTNGKIGPKEMLSGFGSQFLLRIVAAMDSHGVDYALKWDQATDYYLRHITGCKR